MWTHSPVTTILSGRGAAHRSRGRVGSQSVRGRWRIGRCHRLRTPRKQAPAANPPHLSQKRLVPGPRAKQHRTCQHPLPRWPMLRPKHRSGARPPAPTAADRNPLNAYARSFLEWSAVHGRSAQTIETRKRALKRFIAWCDERDLVHPKDVTLPILERYQRYLYHYRKPNGAPLTFGSQQTLLAPLKGFFQWAARERHLLYNPASELLLPRLPRRLPHHILSISDIESILNQPDLGTPSGVRDRAMLEALYSSGIRRMELVHLCLYDVDTRGGSLTVRAGKGGRDRVVPLGERAAAWLDRYLEEVRPVLITGHDEGVCFLTDFGEPFAKNRLGDLVKRYVEGAGLKVIGSCHLFRHAMATHMLDNGADIRYIQAILGHNDLDTTAIYTQVSIHKLKAVHANTHPATLHRLTRSPDEPPSPWKGA